MSFVHFLEKLTGVHYIFVFLPGSETDFEPLLLFIVTVKWGKFFNVGYT